MLRDVLKVGAATFAAMLFLLGSLGSGTVRAAAPPPPFDACLSQSPVDIKSLDCDLWHAPVQGDRFGTIGAVTSHTLRTGAALTVSFAPTGEYFFDRPIVCGLGGCVYHGIAWRPTRGFSFEPVDGCGTTDLSCTFRVWPDDILGDAAERWHVMYVQHYRGVNPMNGVAHAVYIAPRFYPVRLDPVTPAGSPVSDLPQGPAYAVRTGTAPAAAACAPQDWWVSLRRSTSFAVPECITLGLSTGDGAPRFDGVLPVDSGDWTIVAAPAGDAGSALTSRPTLFRPLSVRPVGDDIQAPLVEAARPRPTVAIEPETPTMALGAAQDIQVTVTAQDGETGSLTLAFADPAVLTSTPATPAAVELTAPAEAADGTPFTLAPGEARTFTIRAHALAVGDAKLAALVNGTDDLGRPVTSAGGGAVAVQPGDGPGSGAEAIPPPVVDRAAAAVGGGGHLEGTATGTPGGTVSVTIWTSPMEADGRCSQRATGPGVVAVGSADVTLGDDGSGTFTFDAPLREGAYTYGVTAVGSQVSRIGECLLVAADMPTIAIADASVTEGTSDAGVPTRLEATITLSQPSGVPVSVVVSTADAEATSPDDYRALDAQQVTVAPGETTATVAIEVAADATPEIDETFQIVLSEPVGGRFAGPGTVLTTDALATIEDDDGTPAAGVGDAIDPRGKWGYKQKAKILGKWDYSVYTMNIRSWDPETGAFKGTFVVDPWYTYPTVRGIITGVIKGDQMTLKVTKAGKMNYSTTVKLEVRDGKLMQVAPDGRPVFIRGGYGLLVYK